MTVFLFCHFSPLGARGLFPNVSNMFPKKRTKREVGIALILIGHSFRLCGRPHQTQQTFLKKTESDFSDFTNFS